MANRKKDTQNEGYINYEKEKVLNLAKDLKQRINGKKSGQVVDAKAKANEVSTFSMVKEIIKDARQNSRNEFNRTIRVRVFSSILQGLGPYSSKFLFGGLGDVALKVPGAVMKAASFAGVETIRQRLYAFFQVKGRDTEFILTNSYSNSVKAKHNEEILKKPRPYFKKNDQGALSGIVNSVAMVKSNILKQSIELGSSAIVFGIAIVSMASVAPELALSVAGVTLATSRFGKYMNDRFRKFNNKYDSFVRKIDKENRDSVSNASLVQETSRVHEEIKTIKTKMKRSSYISEKVNRSKSMGKLKFTSVVNVVMQAVITGAALYDVWKTGDIGKFALINGASWQALNSGTSLSDIWNTIQGDVQRIIDTEKKLITPPGLEREIGDKTLSREDTKIRVENITFAYPEVGDVTNNIGDNQDGKVKKGKKVLENVSIEFDKGELTAVIGTSGHGKSTLMNLIRHDYDVDGGNIYIGDKEIREISDEELNAHISFVEQKVHFFDNTLEYNLKYFKPDATIEELEAAIEKAGLKEDVEKFAGGMSYNIGWDGNNLSGGQKQRLALARAFLSDKPIVIMDEPTTGLDQEASLKVMKAVKEMAKEKTVIMVTHNPTEIALVDRVVIVKDGQIVADGSPNDLARANMMGNVLSKEGIKNNENLYERTIRGDNPYKQVNELFNEEEVRVLSDLERKEKRRLLEQNREAYIKARKGALCKRRNIVKNFER